VGAAEDKAARAQSKIRESKYTKARSLNLFTKRLSQATRGYVFRSTPRRILLSLHTPPTPTTSY
jgi:hypothetical protein